VVVPECDEENCFIVNVYDDLDNESAFVQSVWLCVICRWIGVWSEFIGDLVILFAGIFAVLGRDTLSPGLVGLSLSFALQVSVITCHTYIS